MIIYNTCTTKAENNKVGKYELLVWITSLILYKKLGYKLKLYCSSKDIPFLKKENLYEMYDYIDTDCFDNNEKLKQINMSKFWSTRKIEAINKELKINPDAIYSDTDILMFKKFPTDCDCLFWCEEPDKSSVYIDWKLISKPKGYKLPNVIRKTKGAYNCGIMSFSSYDIFKEYYDEYYKFAINNPCELKFDDVQNNIFACNSEQRILKGILNTHDDLTLGFLSDWEDNGFNTNGIHIFIYKALWKMMNKIVLPTDQKNILVTVLNSVKDDCLNILKEYDFRLYNKFSNMKELKGHITEYK